MAAKKKAAKAGAAAVAAKNSPYVQRLIEDEDLRESIVSAYEAARNAYARLDNGKSPAKQIFDDKKLQKELQNAASSLQDVSQGIRGKKKSRGGGLGRKLLVLVIAAGAALALSEGLRKKVLDALFGAEEEFEYTSATTPEAPAPASASPTA
jgi:hypothetical protein